MKKLIFDNIEIKNFLSFGNTPTIFQFEEGINLIVGRNGSGKSNILQSVPFCLYGKTPRKMPKQWYVNDINKKNCLVKLNFHDEQHEYIVSRTVKPDSLDIFIDSELVQSQKVIEYQKFLENKILNDITLNLFFSLIHISINKTQPFLSLTKWQKREFIESLFSFAIYSDLRTFIIEKEKPYMQLKSKAEYSISSFKKLIKDKQDTILQLEKAFRKQKEFSKSKIDDLENKIKRIQDEISCIDKWEKEADQVEAHLNKIREELRKKISLNEQIDKEIADLKERKKRKIKELEIINSNKKCPTCGQDFPENIIQEKIKKIQKTIAKYDQKMDNLIKKKVSLTEIQQLQNEKNKIEKNFSEIEKKLRLLQYQQERMEGFQEELQILLQERTNNNNDLKEMIDKHNKEVKEYYSRIKILEEKVNNFDKYLKYLFVIKESLRDENIKRWALQKVRPFINKKVNEYLAETESDYRILFNEEFEAQFSSRNHYESFSEGEKKKLDLALIFSFRDLLFYQKGVFCDILFIDEFLDSSLDHEAIKVVLDLIKVKQQKDGLKVYITSHNTSITSDLFTKVFKVEKQLFTSINEVK